MKKTIAFLNSKAWYRALKVFYIFLFLIVIIIANFLIITQVQFFNLDKNKTKIICNWWDNKKFSPKDEDIYIDNYDFKNRKFDYEFFFEGGNQYTIKDILKACSGKDTDLDIFALQRWYELGLHNNKDGFISDEQMKEINLIEKETWDSNKGEYLDYSFHFFDIKPVFTYDTFVNYFFYTNVIIILLFEISKRVFYYIVLGTLKPDK